MVADMGMGAIESSLTVYINPRFNPGLLLPDGMAIADVFARFL
jgi:hypothetical protein